MSKSQLIFSMEDFKKKHLNIQNTLDKNPGISIQNNLGLHTSCDPLKYDQFTGSLSDYSDLSKAFSELKKRFNNDFFKDIIASQVDNLNYTMNNVPLMTQILPSAILNDWTSIVRWDKFQRDHILHQTLTSYVVSQLLDSKLKIWKNLKIDDCTDLSTNSTLLDYIVHKIILNLLTNEKDSTLYLKKYLINIELKENHSLLDMKKHYCKHFWKLLVRETLQIASLFHDMGYSWQLIGEINTKLKPANSLIEPIPSSESIYLTYKERMLFLPFNEYAYICNNNIPGYWEKSFLETINLTLAKTHGIYSAIVLMYLFDSTRFTQPSKSNCFHQLAIDWASLAIMMHDMNKVYWNTSKGSETKKTKPKNPQLRLKFSVDPISFILTLSDIIQDFHRPFAIFKTEPKDKDKEDKDQVSLKNVVNYHSSCEEVRLDVNANTMTISYCFDKMQQLKMKQKEYYLQKEQFEYFDRQYGFFDINDFGLKSVEMKAE